MPNGMEAARVGGAEAAEGGERMSRQGGNSPFLTGKEPVRPFCLRPFASLDSLRLLTCPCAPPVPSVPMVRAPRSVSRP